MHARFLACLLMGVSLASNSLAQETTIPSWAVGVFDCRVKGSLAAMTWRLEPGETIVIDANGQTRTEQRFHPLGILQVRGVAEARALNFRGGAFNRLTFYYSDGRTTEIFEIHRQADGSLVDSGGRWRCAPPGQQVPRLRSELELQHSPLRRPGGVDPTDLTRR